MRMLGMQRHPAVCTKHWAETIVSILKTIVNILRTTVNMPDAQREVKQTLWADLCHHHYFQVNIIIYHRKGKTK